MNLGNEKEEFKNTDSVMESLLRKIKILEHDGTSMTRLVVGDTTINCHELVRLHTVLRKLLYGDKPLEPKLGIAQLRQLLAVLMCSDDMDVPELLDFAETHAKRLGFSDWVDAYHNL